MDGEERGDARRRDEGDVSSAGDAAGLFFYDEKGKVISASLSPSAGQRRNGNGREKWPRVCLKIKAVATTTTTIIIIWSPIK